MRGIFAAVAALALSGATDAEDRLSRIAVTPQSEGALLIMRAPIVEAQYMIDLSRVKSSADGEVIGVLDDWVSITIRVDRAAYGYFVRTVKPGRYVVKSVTQQDYWAICFHDASLQFDIEPGQAIYLGEFDGMRALSELQANVKRNHDLTSRGSKKIYFDDIGPPRFMPVAANDLAVASKFVRLTMPRTSAIPISPHLWPVKFMTRKSLAGTRIC